MAWALIKLSALIVHRWWATVVLIRPSSIRRPVFAERYTKDVVDCLFPVEEDEVLAPIVVRVQVQVIGLNRVEPSDLR